jgi:methyltransferase (TIGR00027 family)
MKFNRASMTAQGIALIRALESNKPEDERVAYDPLAVKFIPGWLWAMGRFFDSTGYSERRGPGVVGFIAARERTIDEVLRSALLNGANQGVILGAGYDSRAYRMEEMKTARVFEVDLPATQDMKVARLREILPKIPTNVTFVPVDFNTQTLEDRLLSSGYDPSARTVFVWQGVVYYLQPEAVDATLGFITRFSAPGSTLIFDYADESYLHGGHSEIRNTNRYGRATGEQLKFAIPDGGLDKFLSDRGFRVAANYRAADMHRMYFTGKREKRTISPGYGIAVAEIIGK